MTDMGFETLIDNKYQGKLITVFKYPIKFNYKNFHDKLKSMGFIIYAGIEKNTFRVGSFGNITSCDIKKFLSKVKSIT